MNFIDLVTKAVAIDSSPKHGSKEIAEFYASVAKDMGFDVELSEEIRIGVPQSLLVVKSKQSNAEKDLALFSQLDTPSPGDFVRWTKTGGNPFSAVVSGEDLHGLGVARGKIDFLIKLFALKELGDKKFTKLNPILFGSFGDQTGAGALRMIRKKTYKPEFALVAAPTGLQPATVAPGYATLQVFVPFSAEEKRLKIDLEFEENVTTESKMFTAKMPKNRAVEHDDTPIGQMLNYLKNLPKSILLLGMSGGERSNQLADSAWLELQMVDSLEDTIIEKLVSLNETLLRFTGELRAIKDENFYPNHSNINIGVVRTRPDGIRFILTCRFVANVTKEQNLKWLNDFEKECKEKGVDFQLLENREPYVLREQSDYYDKAMQIMKDMGMSIEPVSTQWSNDANVLQRFKIPSLVIGGAKVMPEDLISEEKISLTEVNKLQDFYKSFIESVCL